MVVWEAMSSSENDSCLVVWEAIAVFFWGMLYGMLIFDSYLRGDRLFRHAVFFGECFRECLIWMVVWEAMLFGVPERMFDLDGCLGGERFFRRAVFLGSTSGNFEFGWLSGRQCFF